MGEKMGIKNKRTRHDAGSRLSRARAEADQTKYTKNCRHDDYTKFPWLGWPVRSRATVSIWTVIVRIWLQIDGLASVYQSQGREVNVHGTMARPRGPHDADRSTQLGCKRKKKTKYDSHQVNVGQKKMRSSWIMRRHSSERMLVIRGKTVKNKGTKMTHKELRLKYNAKGIPP